MRAAVLCLLAVLLVPAARATVGVVHVEHHVELDGPPAPGTTRILTLHFEGRTDVTVGGLDVRGDGWSVEPLEPGWGRNLAEGRRAAARFRVTTGKESGPLFVSYLAAGHRREDVLHFDERGRRRTVHLGTLQRAPMDAPAAGFAPGPTPGRRAPVGVIPEFAAAGIAPAPQGSAAAAVTYTVTGRIIHARKDGRILGVDGATVFARDFNAGGLAIPLGNPVTTDENGNFTLQFDWFSLPTDTYPDVYLRVWALNGWVVVGDGGSDSDLYIWNTPTEFDVSATTVDMGTWRTEGTDFAAHVLTTATRGYRWLDREWGHTPEAVTYHVPQGTNATYFHGTDWKGDPYYRIEMDHTRRWEERTILHELGHHVMNRFAVLLSPDYCNTECDDGEVCGHCRWCSEDSQIAYSEGWANWFAYVVLDDWTDDYGYAPDYGEYREWIRPCRDDQYGIPDFTEGNLEALLTDIDDVHDEKDTVTTEEGVDRLSLGHQQILTVSFVDDPTTSRGFVQAFKSRYPVYATDLWATAANNGLDYDSFAPVTHEPTSSSHQEGVASTDLTPNLQLGGSDGWSGVAGWSVRLSELAPLAPPETKTHDADDPHTIRVGPLSANSAYYVTVRAVDRAGNWDDGYKTFGPIVTVSPEPADLEPVQTIGWTHPLVPRNTEVPSAFDVTLPSGVLNNDVYWNYGLTNAGGSPTSGGYSVQLLRDGSPAGQRNHAALDAGADALGTDLGTVPVTGGRHVLAMYVDSGEDLLEGDETDNGWGRQFIFNPFTFLFTLGTTAPSPPPRTAGWETVTWGSSWYNCSGFRMVTDTFVPDPWVAAVLVPTWSLDDYDLRLHAMATTSGSGFSTNHGFSARSSGLTDAVLVNAEAAPAIAYDLGVVNPMSAAGQDFDLQVEYADTLLHAQTYSGSFASGEALKLLVFDAGPTTDGFKTIRLELGPGTWSQPYHLSWYDGTTFSRGELLEYDASATTDWTLEAHLDITLPEGRHAFAVWRDPINGDLLSRDFTVRIAFQDEDVVPHAPAGWAGSLVPRPAADATPTWAPAPTSLVGDAAATWINFGTRNDSQVGTGYSVYTRIRLDGVSELFVNQSTFSAGEEETYLGTSPIQVSAGRHTLSGHRNVISWPNEADGDNNFDGVQYVWTPTTLPAGQYVQRSAPPDRVGGWSQVAGASSLFYNCDGVRVPQFPRGPGGGDWGAVAVMPLGPADGYDLRLHETSTNAGDGFAESVAWSGWTPGEGHFVLAYFGDGDARALDAGVVESGAGGSDYLVQAEASVRLDVPAQDRFTGLSLPADDLLDVYEIGIAAADAYRIRLRVPGGSPADLGMSLYSNDDGDVPKWNVDVSPEHGAGIVDLDAGESDAYLWLTTDDPDSLALAVWKRAGDDAGQTVAYELWIESSSRTAVGGDPAAPAVRLRAVPNPFHSATSLRFELEEPGRVTLDAYDVSGRRVARVEEAALGAGRHRVSWDGRDDRGGPLASGTYFLLLRTARGESRERVVVLP